MAHETDAIGYPIDPELRKLEFYLGDLAARWRGSYDRPDVQEALVREYWAVLNQLYALGWDSLLDIESELPDRLMPEEYMRRNSRTRSD